MALRHQRGEERGRQNSNSEQTTRRFIVTGAMDTNQVWAGSAKLWDADGLGMSGLGRTPLHGQGEPASVRGEETKSSEKSWGIP